MWSRSSPEAERDEKIVAVTAAMPDGTGLDLFASRFPKRCFDVGIAEQHAVTFSAGLAAGGMNMLSQRKGSVHLMFIVSLRH